MVDNSQREKETVPPTPGAPLGRDPSREFDLASEDWREVLPACRSVLGQVSSLAREARDTQGQQGKALNAAQISEINRRLATHLRVALGDLNVRLSAIGRESLRKGLQALASNTTTVRMIHAN